MARPLKVYGCTVTVTNEVAAALGLRPHVRQAHVAVAARSQAEAAALLGVSANEMRNYGGETGNPETVELAMSQPGQPFARPLSPADGHKTVNVAPSLESPHVLKPDAVGSLDLADALRSQEKAEREERKRLADERERERDERAARAAARRRAIAEAIERVRPKLVELGFHADVIAPGHGGQENLGRHGILLPAEVVESLVASALEAEIPEWS